MTGLELAWVHTMVLQDDKEAYDEKLSFIEYLASFSNPEGVKKVREDRKRAKFVSDDDFKLLTRELFGREAPKAPER